MAEHIGPDHFIVRQLTVQGGGRFASFVRGTRSALRALSEYFRQSGHDYTRFNYLGEWHSHPSFSVQPSHTDHRSMLDIVTNAKVGANFVVLLIFKLVDREALEGSAHTYLPDGTIAPSTLVLEGQS
jgi:integrative and conjugative element protein (TIGR02256 family)